MLLFQPECCFPAGTDVLQSAGHHRRLHGSGQRGGGGVQTESPQQIPAVYWTSFPGGLPHLHGKTHTHCVYLFNYCLNEDNNSDIKTH